MHKVQAEVLSQIVAYVQDKIGKEPQIYSFVDDSGGEITVNLKFRIGRDYPGMKQDPED